jgi:hypothetical protein
MIGVFHIILHVFECLLICGCIMVQCKLLEDYDALRGWIEFTFKMDLNKLAERIEEWKKEEGIT